MPAYTKLTIVEYQDTVDQVPPALVDELFTTASQMVSEGKTDGSYNFENIHTVSRNWVDQAAAEAWINFITPLHATYNVVLTNVSIIDNPNP